MTVTQAQLQSVMKFDFGSATHRVVSYTCATSLERTGVGHDAFRRFTYTIVAELEGATLANLKAQLDSAKSGLIDSGHNFKIYRAGTVIHQHDAADCHFGPVARIDTQAAAGTFEHCTIVVECVVPVSTAGGLIDHTYTSATQVDDENQTVSIVQSGRVITTEAQSAVAWINANLPAQGAGFDRTVDISADDTDSSANYTVRDVETTRRNYDATVRDHKFVKTTTTRQGEVKTIAWAGTVRMVDGNSARTFIEANLPAATVGYAREYTIGNSDDDLDGTYSVTDTLADWTGLPGIDAAQQTNEQDIDEHGRIRLTRSGYFIGANAATEVDNARTALAALGRLISETVSQDVYDDQRYTFRFTAISTVDASGITLWQETITKRGGGRVRVASVFPDLNPYYFYGPTQPIAVELVGRAVALRNSDGTDHYVAVPPVPADLIDYLSGAPEFDTSRPDKHYCETSWRMRFLVPVDAVIPKPRNPIVAFMP